MSVSHSPSRPEAAPYHCLTLPTPFPVGPVNTYLLPGDPPVLIDCGVRSSKSIAALEQALADHGVTVEQLGAILLTHPHYDHSGAAVTLSARAGLPARYHPLGEGRAERSRQAFRDALQRYGAPASLFAELDAFDRMGDRFGEPLRRAPRRAPLEDGAVLQAGRLALEVLHTPGHNAAHLCFLSREQGLLFTGDLLLTDITPNPLPHFDPEAPRGRRSSLALFLESLDRVEALGPLRGLGGHGPPMADTAAVARRSREAILRRSEQVRRLCRAHRGETLFALGDRLFGEPTGLGRTLAFSEILAHCDWLEAQGRLTVDHDTGRVQG
jgi:glyoxylase-like metal-dependent hydrolase (beta-lactamase superfamily II)